MVAQKQSKYLSCFLRVIISEDQIHFFNKNAIGIHWFFLALKYSQLIIRYPFQWNNFGNITITKNVDHYTAYCVLLVSCNSYKTFLCNNIHVEISLRIICIFEGSYVLIMLTLLELTFLLCIKGAYYYSYALIIITYSCLFWQLMSLDSFIHIVRFFQSSILWIDLGVTRNKIA